jgi:hypothetical protein
VARRQELLAAAAARQIEQAARGEEATRVAEKAVNDWLRGRPLHQLLTDVRAIYPTAPSIDLAFDASSHDLKRAYMKVARAIHPDKVAPLYF